MKVSLVNLPWKINGNWGVRAGSRWPHIKDNTERDYLCFPFFLAYATSLLKKHDIEARIIDAIASEISYEVFLKRVEENSPDLLVVETSTVSLEHDINFINKINKNVRIIMCGLDYSITHPQFLKNNPKVDYVLAGEYEFNLLKLVQSLRQNNGLEEVPGILYRDKRGEVCVNPRGTLGNIDTLPWPSRDELPMDKYTDAPGGMPLANVQMLASRGCPFKCIFCAWPQLMYHGNQFRSRNIKDVVNEMEYVVQKMKFKSIYFDDDTFNIGRDRMLKFAHEVRMRNEESRLNVPWAMMARADLMDEEVLVNLADAGLHTVKYGIESAEQRLLNNAKKNMNIKQAADMVKFTKSLGIKVHLTFTFGLPGEDKDTIKKTIDFALALDPISLQFSITTPYPGTSYYKELEQNGMLMSKNISDYDGNYNSVIKTEKLTSEDLKEAKDRAWHIWGEHSEAKRGYKKVKINREYLIKFRDYLKDYGFRYTFKKSIDFASFVIKNNFFLRTIKQHSITNEEIAIVFDKGKICLFWDGMLLTKDVGLNSSIQSRDKWYDSSTAKWKILEKKENSIVIKNYWEYLPVEQIWNIVIGKENIIHWNIDMVVKRDFRIKMKKCGLLISEQYTKWFSTEEQGTFPRICDWEEIPLRNSRIKTIGVYDTRQIKGKFPTIKFSFLNHEEGLSEIQNTSRAINGRMLQAKFIDGEKMSKGKYNFFSGKLVLEE